MHLNEKTLEQLRIIINGDNNEKDYRSGPKLVKFFNELGFSGGYDSNFPSRWLYTDECLKKLNGTLYMENCIKKTFNVLEYIERLDELDALIEKFNLYLAFEKYKLIRDNEKIEIKKLNKIIIGSSKKISQEEENFLNLTFEVNLNLLDINADLRNILEKRIIEIESCINNEANLSAMILIGSVLEGVLLNTAKKHAKLFNQSNKAPKSNKDGKIKRFSIWKLNDLINVASDIGILQRDIEKFSHTLREFRNYIHPNQQVEEGFYPDKNTNLICYQVLKAAIVQIIEFEENEK